MMHESFTAGNSSQRVHTAESDCIKLEKVKKQQYRSVAAVKYPRDEVATVIFIPRVEWKGYLQYTVTQPSRDTFQQCADSVL